MKKFHELIDLIGSEYGNLPASQRKVAEYLVSNLPQVVDHNSRSIARAIGVSDATVIRFAAAIGYSGYAEFQAEVRKAILSERSISRIHSAVSRNDRGKTLREHIAEEHCSIIRNTLETVPEEKFTKAVRMCTEAEKILVLGGRTLYGPAFLLAHKLNLCLGNASIISNGGNYEYDQLLSMTPGHLFIVMSFERYSRRIYEYTAFARKRTGAKIIALTDSSLAPVNALADLALPLKESSRDSLESTVGLVSFIEILAAGVMKKDPVRTRNNLHRMEQFIAPEIWFPENSEDPGTR